MFQFWKIYVYYIKIYTKEVQSLYLQRNILIILNFYGFKRLNNGQCVWLWRSFGAAARGNRWPDKLEMNLRGVDRLLITSYLVWFMNANLVGVRHGNVWCRWSKMCLCIYDVFICSYIEFLSKLIYVHGFGVDLAQRHVTWPLATGANVFFN